MWFDVPVEGLESFEEVGCVKIGEAGSDDGSIITECY